MEPARYNSGHIVSGLKSEVLHLCPYRRQFRREYIISLSIMIKWNSWKKVVHEMIGMSKENNVREQPHLSGEQQNCGIGIAFP